MHELVIALIYVDFSPFSTGVCVLSPLYVTLCSRVLTMAWMQNVQDAVHDSSRVLFVYLAFSFIIGSTQFFYQYFFKWKN